MAKGEYSEIVSKLSKAKKHLIELKNQKLELDMALSELENTGNQNEKDIETLNRHICPLCSSELVNTVAMKADKYNIGDDIIIISNDIQRSVLDIDSKIDRETSRYRDLLELLEKYETKLDISSVQINDVLKHKGFIEVRDSLLNEMDSIHKILEKTRTDSEELVKNKHKYDVAKKSINKKYYELLVCDKMKFGLSEIDEKKFENITRNFTASGSNKPIATVMWYLNLIKLKNEFNPKAIKFPIVFDSPNNAETDDMKKHELLSYLLENATEENQLIISAIGFDKYAFSKTNKCKVITLTNDKYSLLNESEFEKHRSLLFELCNKQ